MNDFMTYQEYLEYLEKQIAQLDQDKIDMVRAMDSNVYKVKIALDIDSIKKPYIDEMKRIKDLLGR